MGGPAEFGWVAQRQDARAFGNTYQELVCSHLEVGRVIRSMKARLLVPAAPNREAVGPPSSEKIFTAETQRSAEGFSFSSSEMGYRKNRVTQDFTPKALHIVAQGRELSERTLG